MSTGRERAQQRELEKATALDACYAPILDKPQGISRQQRRDHERRQLAIFEARLRKEEIQRRRQKARVREEDPQG